MLQLRCVRSRQALVEHPRVSVSSVKGLWQEGL